MSRAYGYGLLNSKLNTIESLLLTSQGGGGTTGQNLDQVLEAGETAVNKEVILTDADGSVTSRLSNNSLLFEQPNEEINAVYSLTSMRFDNNINGSDAMLLENNGLSFFSPDPIDPDIVTFPVTITRDNLTYIDSNNTDNRLSLNSGGISVQQVSEEDTYTLSLGTTTITLESVTTNPLANRPSATLDVGTLIFNNGALNADDARTSYAQGAISMAQTFLGENKDLFQIVSNKIAMYDLSANPTELVEVAHNGDNGYIGLRDRTNAYTSILTNKELNFNYVSGNNIAIGEGLIVTGDDVNYSRIDANRVILRSNNSLAYLSPTENEILKSQDIIKGIGVTLSSVGFSQTNTAFGAFDLSFSQLSVGGIANDPTKNQVLGVNSSGTLEYKENWTGTATSNLNMGTYDITSTSGTLDISANNIQITGQANFVSPPHIPEPILGNDAASKGYVDSLVGQYSGGFNLFLNYSDTSTFNPSYKVLSQTVSISAVQTVDITFSSGTQEVAQFITEPLGVTEIPTGLWDAFIFGSVSSTGGDVHYTFQLFKVTALGVSTLITTSGISPDVNSSPNNNPTSYSMIALISSPVTLDLTDRIAFVLNATKTGGSSTTLRTFFEGTYYSFFQSTLNAVTTILSSNNTWTGINNFALPPTTPTNPTPANDAIINYGDISTLLGNTDPIVSTLNYYISTLSPFFQYPPAPPTAALINAYQYYGWYFINSVALRKIDWYFAPDYQMTVADVKGLYMNYLNITTTSNDNLPFISIYTKPTGTNDAIPGFAHSVAVYIPNFTPTAGTPFCSFMNISGTQPDPFPYGHQLGSMILSPVQPNPRGEYLPTEEVLAVSVGSASGSSVNQVNFIMSKVGICLEQGNQELILNPQNISEQPTLSTVLGFGNTAGNQSITGVNNLSATSVTTPTLANGAATLTVGTVGQITNIVGTLQNNGAELPAYISSSGVASGSIDMNSNSITECNSLDSVSSLTLGGTTALGVNVGRATQTTNLLGNVQFNSSSGTSGHVLTSTGASTAPTFQALPTPYISSGGVVSGTLDMNNNFLLKVNGIDASGIPVAIGQGGTSLGVSIGRATQTTNLNGNVTFNTQAGTSGQVLTSNGTGTVPTWQTLSTPYISSGGVSSGAINMNTNAITSCPSLDSASALALGNTTATGVSVGRLTQTTDLVGNVRINGSSGLTGQALISTGASTTPTWQPLAVNTTYFQSTDASVSSAGGSSLRAKLTFNVPTSTATYLFSFSAISGPSLASGVGGQTFMTFTYEKGTSTSFTGSRNFIDNALANVALTNSTCVSAAVSQSVGFIALAGQRIYTVSTGTAFVAGDYSFCALLYNPVPFNVRQMTLSAIQLTA